MSIRLLAPGRCSEPRVPVRDMRCVTVRCATGPKTATVTGEGCFRGLTAARSAGIDDRFMIKLSKRIIRYVPASRVSCTAGSHGMSALSVRYYRPSRAKGFGRTACSSTIGLST